MARTIRTPAIPMDNPFTASFEAKSDVLQYLAVEPGDLEAEDHMVDVLSDTGFDDGDCGIITGIAQEDKLEGEWVRVVYYGTTWAYAGPGGVIRDLPLEAVYNVLPALNGRLITATSCAEGTMIVGIALELANVGVRFKAFLTRIPVVRISSSSSESSSSSSESSSSSSSSESSSSSSESSSSSSESSSSSSSESSSSSSESSSSSSESSESSSSSSESSESSSSSSESSESSSSSSESSSSSSSSESSSSSSESSSSSSESSSSSSESSSSSSSESSSSSSSESSSSSSESSSSSSSVSSSSSSSSSFLA